MNKAQSHHVNMEKIIHKIGQRDDSLYVIKMYIGDMKILNKFSLAGVNEFVFGVKILNFPTQVLNCQCFPMNNEIFINNGFSIYFNYSGPLDSLKALLIENSSTIIIVNKLNGTILASSSLNLGVFAKNEYLSPQKTPKSLRKRIKMLNKEINKFIGDVEITLVIKKVFNDELVKPEQKPKLKEIYFGEPDANYYSLNVLYPEMIFNKHKNIFSKLNNDIINEQHEINNKYTIEDKPERDPYILKEEFLGVPRTKQPDYIYIHHNVISEEVNVQSDPIPSLSSEKTYITIPTQTPVTTVISRPEHTAVNYDEFMKKTLKYK